ncbi:MAG: NUDIX domain-containing protein, partial [Gammaproteobacteria bacterium]
MEPGETPENAAAREVEEETGLTVTALRELFAEGDERCFVATCDAGRRHGPRASR